MYNYIEINGLECQRCEGWTGKNPPGWIRDINTECANRNNQCFTNFYCLKIVNPKGRHSTYETYSSKCYDSNQLVTYPGRTESIENDKCYEVSDGGTPAIVKKYCFCRDKDHCNGNNKNLLNKILLLIIFTKIILNFFY
uniref:UPAR/Ly6 domain-containing protein n=1 Tax=Strongyloides stercoralis TaxID=6248 RepID=A0AAF5DB81_STRER